ncbi:MAG: uroporphyrinogen decarboxylase family protein [Spirochaetota bacterium]
MQAEMTSLQRVLTTLGHHEPGRVPLFLLTTMHGARELGITIKEYFSSADNVVEGQLRLLAKYKSDCIYSFFHASLEAEAWNGETIFSEDGPPNAGAPVIGRVDDIMRLEAPHVLDCKGLRMVLDATGKLKKHAGAETPILGVVMSPFSLPVMQLGFDRYIDIIYERPDLLERLLQINEEFCVEWANSQFDAGAAAICYFDPVTSTSIVPIDISRKYGFPSAARTISRFKGPAAIHFASGRCLPILDDVTRTGSLAVGVSSEENLKDIKAACLGRIAIVGNLNAIEMRHWSQSQVENAVKDAIAKAAPGGGFILSDNHGEIPWQVGDDVLLAVSKAVQRWGQYPLEWVDAYNGK